MHNVVALGLYNLILRPNEFIDFRISNIDYEKLMPQLKEELLLSELLQRDDRQDKLSTMPGYIKTKNKEGHWI